MCSCFEVCLSLFYLFSMAHVHLTSIIFIIVCSLFVSCFKTNNLTLTTSHDSLTISPNTTYLSFAAYTDKAGNLFYSLYDEYDSTIKIINIKSKVSKSVKVPFSNRIEVENPLKDYIIHNFDSIFLQHHYQISIIDTSGKIKYEYLINAPFSDTFPDTIRNSLGSLFSMYYNEISKELYLRQYSGKYYSWSKGYYSIPVEAVFKLRDSLFKDVAIYYPNKYQQNYYGDLNNVYHTVAGKNDIFSFEADENIYILNKENGKISKNSCKSTFDTSDVQPLSTKYKDDINKRIDHLTVSPCYLKILYDPYRKLYYRFFSAAVPLRNKNGTYNTHADKKLYLMVLDNKFKLLKEYPLKNNEWYWSFITEKGLYLQRTLKGIVNQNTENGQQIIFDIFTFSLD